MQLEGDRSEAYTAKPATSFALGMQERAAEMQQCLTSTFSYQNFVAAPHPPLTNPTRRNSIAAALDLKIDVATTCDPSVGNFTARKHTLGAAATQEILVDVSATDEVTVDDAATPKCVVDVATFYLSPTIMR
ncbi:hypothetical protein ACH5RR_026196 [Cinchona calisaya]|uniref:Uncharacterized protein n=1 Tax=Cinchona calisaya TaxID=153742 RepID=A0ABD2Z1U5_9GENT